MSEVRFPGDVPSWDKFYNRFSTASSRKCNCENILPEDWGTKLRNELGNHEVLRGSSNMFPEAYCCACEMKEKQSLADTPCYFFYYWVENIATKELDTTNLAQALEKIYRAVGSTTGQSKCNIVYKDDALWTMYKLRRQVYEFTYDYSNIESSVKICEPVKCLEYLTYLQGVKAACDLVSPECKGPSAGGQYCDDYNTKYKQYCETELPALMSLCSERKNPNQAGSSGSFSDADVDCSVDKFPSKQIYSRFDGEGEYTKGDVPGCNRGMAETYLNSLLGQFGSIKDDATKITKAWCYVAKGAREKRKREEIEKIMEGNIYDLFYFWLGDKVRNSKGRSNEFSNAMSAIYGSLRSTLTGINCGLTDENIDEDTFNNAKVVYEYTEDYETIEGCIRKFETCGSKCTEGYAQYLEKAVISHGEMEDYCRETKNSTKVCCKHFKKMFEQGSESKILKPSELKSKLDHVQKTTMHETKTIPTASTTTPTAPIISSVLGTLIGLPAAVFFLYKYNLLPPWISNYFANNNSSRRKRRSNMRDFDTFTENSSTFDSASEYTTSVSTADSTDGSTIYNRRVPPSTTKRGANNTRGHQNIAYQNM